MEEAAAAELVCCRPTIGQKCYSWEELSKIGGSFLTISSLGLENHSGVLAAAQMEEHLRELALTVIKLINCTNKLHFKL